MDEQTIVFPTTKPRPFDRGYDSGFARKMNHQPLPAEAFAPPPHMSQYFTGMLVGWNDARFDLDTSDEELIFARHDA